MLEFCQRTADRAGRQAYRRVMLAVIAKQRRDFDSNHFRQKTSVVSRRYKFREDLVYIFCGLIQHASFSLTSVPKNDMSNSRSNPEKAADDLTPTAKPNDGPKPARRCFVVIPAAGFSRRMGQPKLLMRWKSKTIIEHVIAAWQAAGVERVVIVVRQSDCALAECALAAGARVVQPDSDPVDMKASLIVGLQYLEANVSPLPADRCFFAPADLPEIHASLIGDLLAVSSGLDEIVVPYFGGRRGHPVLFPWRLTTALQALAADEGLDRILSTRPHKPVHFDSNLRAKDIDNLYDYRRLLGTNP